MGRRRGGGSKTKSRKPVKVQLLDRMHAGKVTQPYQIMEEYITDHHPHLGDAKIAIAWALGWKQDADGRLKLGQMKKGSDLDREMHGYDFVMVLNHGAWNEAGFTKEQMEALIDHELCHADVAKDSSGEVKKDDRGRIVYRIRKHSIEEFHEVFARHGCWKSDIASFAKIALDGKNKPLFKGNGAPAMAAKPQAQAHA